MLNSDWKKKRHAGARLQYMLGQGDGEFITFREGRAIFDAAYTRSHGRALLFRWLDNVSLERRFGSKESALKQMRFYKRMKDQTLSTFEEVLPFTLLT